MKTNVLRFALFPLLALSALSLQPSASAQGTVTLDASVPHGSIQYSTDGTSFHPVPVGNPAQIPGFGQLNIAFYSAPVGTPDPFTATSASLLPAAWAESTTVLHEIGPLAGNTPTFTFTLGNIAGGANAEVKVLGWTGNFTDWNSAITAGTGLLAWSGSIFNDGALSWVNATGDPKGTPPTPGQPIPYGGAGFDGLALMIPEPSSFALAGVGAVMLFFLRRRR